MYQALLFKCIETLNKKVQTMFAEAEASYEMGSSRVERGFIPDTGDPDTGARFSDSLPDVAMTDVEVSHFTDDERFPAALGHYCTD